MANYEGAKRFAEFFTVTVAEHSAQREPFQLAQRGPIVFAVVIAYFQANGRADHSLCGTDCDTFYFSERARQKFYEDLKPCIFAVAAW